MQPQKVEISRKTIVFTVLFLLSLLILWQLRGIVLLIFVCFVFMESINPTVEKLEHYRLPRPLAILLLYFLLISLVSFTVASIVPLLVEQTSGLISALPELIQNTRVFGFSAMDFSGQLRILENLPSAIYATTLGLAGNLFSIFVVLFVTFYLLLERPHLDVHATNFFGSQTGNRIKKILHVTEKRLGAWVTAEILLMTIVGLLSYFGYLFLGLNYAVPLALLAGLLEIVPSIGPTISTIIAGIVALTISPLTALLTVVWGIVVQQLENNFIVPKVMKETIGLHPLVTIVLIAAGAQLAGVLGAVLAVPTFLTLEVIFQVVSETNSRQKG